MAYSCYGTILIWHVNEAQLAYQLGLLSLKISDRFQDLNYKCRACNMLANHIMPWVRHGRFSHAVNEEAFTIGLESGDIQFVGFSSINKVGNRLFGGDNLSDIAAALPSLIQFASKPKNITVLDTLIARQLGIFYLTGKTLGESFDSELTTETAYISHCESHQDYYSLCIYYTFKTQILYLHQEYRAALSYSLAATPWLPIVRGLIPEAEHNYYSSLTMLALYDTADESEQLEYRQKIAANQQQMQIWVDNCPENFADKHDLVTAETARVEDRHLAAMELYDRAIAGAREHKFIHNEALGNELTGRFWLAKNKQDFADLYLRKAYSGYRLWGAQRKAAALEAQYPLLLSANATEISTIEITRNTSSRHSGALDLSCAIEASQALAGEMVLDKLLKKLMQILIKNAGAQRGFLILKKDHSWLIEAEGTADNNEAIVLQSIAIDSLDPTQAPFLATAIVNYVTRTQENIILNDATREGQFTGDRYILDHQPKSILCVPLLNHGKAIGILYLENNLTTGVFTPERVEVLILLSAQAAISIESSRLYSQLEDYSYTLERKVNERTYELRQANRELERLANLDGLTQVANRRYFDTYLTEKWQRLALEGRPLGFILFDVDFFKRYNDRYGHQAGDDCLIQVAQAAQTAAQRGSDLVARYGGEEFAVVLPDTTLDNAIAIAISIQEELLARQIIHAASDVSQFVTISMGLFCQIPLIQGDSKQMISRADTALYQAKQQGRNSYCIAH
ncbi:MAG: diguanylate cyclase [Cyanobacteria bacterium J06623_7]